MAGPEACRISGLLELPGSATYYETAPLAGTKRQNDETDEVR